MLCVEEIRNFKQSKKFEELGELRIGTHQSLLNSNLWKPIRSLKKQFPKVNIDLFTGGGDYLSKLLEKEDLDIIVSLDNFILPREFKATKIYQGKFVVVGKNVTDFNQKTPLLVTHKNKHEVQHLIKNNPSITIEELASWSAIKISF